jgi:modulator of FtsH protease
MNDHLRTTTIPRTAGVEMDEGARKVLRNTWNLLAMTLLFAGFMALRRYEPSTCHPGMLVFLGGAFRPVFLTNALRNSAWGMVAVFAFTGFHGRDGRLDHQSSICRFRQWPRTGDCRRSFHRASLSSGLSGFAMVTKKDFSFMGAFLFVGLLVAFVAVLAAYFFQMSAVAWRLRPCSRCCHRA